MWHKGKEGDVKWFRADESSLTSHQYMGNGHGKAHSLRVGGPQAMHNGACRGRGESGAVAFAAGTQTQPLRLV